MLYLFLSRPHNVQPYRAAQGKEVIQAPAAPNCCEPAYGEKWAVYESESGTAALVFAFGPVAEPSFLDEGIAVLASTLELNSGAIASQATGAAALDHAGLDHDPVHKVDHTPAHKVDHAPAPEENAPPVFNPDNYSFSIAESAETWETIGLVSASDPDAGDTVTCWITAGNGAGRFEIDLYFGEIMVWGALDHETVPTYTLTVEARYGNDNGRNQRDGRGRRVRDAAGTRRTTALAGRDASLEACGPLRSGSRSAIGCVGQLN